MAGKGQLLVPALAHWMHSDTSRAPLVGRDREMAQIAEARGAGDYPGLVVVGEAGVGKTRLARAALMAAADDGALFQWVQATRSAATIPARTAADADHASRERPKPPPDPPPADASPSPQRLTEGKHHQRPSQQHRDDSEHKQGRLTLLAPRSEPPIPAKRHRAPPSRDHAHPSRQDRDNSATGASRFTAATTTHPRSNGTQVPQARPARSDALRSRLAHASPGRNSRLKCQDESPAARASAATSSGSQYPGQVVSTKLQVNDVTARGGPASCIRPSAGPRSNRCRAITLRGRWRSNGVRT